MPLDETVLKLILPLECKQALEIGCFQGNSTLILAKYFSNITCIDPWDDDYVIERPNFSFADKSTWVGQHQTFLQNTEHISNKLTLLRHKSKDVLPQIPDATFNFVFVDGDHSAEAVTIDAEQSFRVCKAGGIILFDDYSWFRQNTGPKEAIDAFLTKYDSAICVVYKTDAYVAVRKMS